MKIKKLNQNGMIPVFSKEPYIGVKGIDTSLPKVEEFLKDEIVAAKTCACPACNYRRTMLREIQYIVNDYVKEHRPIESKKK